MHHLLVKIHKMEVIKRGDLEKLTVKDIQKRLESDVVVFADQIKNETSDEKLKDLEKELMEVFKENDEYLKTVEYSLGSDTEYDGVKIKRSAVIDKIIYLINKIEVEFRATLGIYQAIKFWKGVGGDAIPYVVYDATLRLLGMLKFKGESECFDILVINNWFATVHEQYAKDNIYTQYLASLHNEILNQLKQNSPTGDETKEILE